MVFNSLTFLAFVAVVIGVYRLPLPWTAKKIHLLVASYVFYAAWNPPFVLLIWISTLIDWHVANRLVVTESRGARRALLLLSLGTNLGLLGFFKYGNFLLGNFVRVLAMVGVEYHPPALGIVLPVGISFYTFQTLSYTIDVYRRERDPSPSFLDFALYVTFFPQLVAGPIVRAGDFLPQCVSPRRTSGDQMGWGLSLFVIGLFQKVVLADGLMAPVADQVYDAATRTGFVAAWVGTLAFSAQIFFDFAGYSTCAIGMALCLGFELPDNFRFPYGAIGFSDFWRRWHISLSTWLRDYLYIPLGGSRRGPMRTRVYLMVTMLLGGLWHGAAWRFVVWGGLHGSYLVVERFLRARWGDSRWIGRPHGKLLLVLGTYLLVCLTWVFFRAQTFDGALAISSAMLGAGGGNLVVSEWTVIKVVAVTVGLLAAHWSLRHRSLEDAARPMPWPLRGAILGVLVALILVMPGDDRAFIYFQF